MNFDKVEIYFAIHPAFDGVEIADEIIKAFLRYNKKDWYIASPYLCHNSPGLKKNSMVRIQSRRDAINIDLKPDYNSQEASFSNTLILAVTLAYHLKSLYSQAIAETVIRPL